MLEHVIREFLQRAAVIGLAASTCALASCAGSANMTPATGAAGTAAQPATAPMHMAAPAPSTPVAGAAVASGAAGRVADPSAGAPSPMAAGRGGAAATSAANGGAGASATAGATASTTAGATASTTAGASATAGAAANPSGAGFHCPAGPFGAPVPAGASAQRVEGFPPLDSFNDDGNLRTNLEGPVWIGDKLYVSEFPFTPAPQSRILAFDPARNQTSVALEHASSNGLATDASGALLAADHGLGAIVRMTFPLGMPEVLVGSYDGQRFDSPNDLAVHSDGTIFFSDPDYQAPTSKPQPKTRLYRLAKGASAATVIDETRSQPNGVTLSADERTLYVSGADGIYTYALTGSEVSAGSGMRLNSFGGSADGLGMDCAGNLYATSGQRVVVLDPRGMELGSIAVPQAESVTNVAFGGAEHKTLFITSMGSGSQRGLYRVELNVPGLSY